MGQLYFKVASDWQEVVRLREEISKLKQELTSMDVNKAPAAAKALQTQISTLKQEMNGFVSEAYRAGVAMEVGFKKKIFDASQSVNGFTEKIIAQKAVVKDTEADVKRLGEAYRIALKRNPLSAGDKLADYTTAKKALDEDKAALFGLTQEQANARLSVKKLRDEYALYDNDAKRVVDTNNGITISWKKALAVIGGVGVLKSLISDVTQVRMEIDSVGKSFEALLKSDSKAKEMVGGLKDLAIKSGLNTYGAAQTLLGFNVDAEKIIPSLKSIGDITMGNNEKFSSMTLAFAQMSAAGRLMGQDLNQMINAGFNPLQIISEKTGKSIAILKKEMGQGAISSEMVADAFSAATAEGGRFYNMLEKQNTGIRGERNKQNAVIKAKLNEIGEANEDIIAGSYRVTTKLIENYETIGKVLAGLVATYGTYRTAVMLATAAESKHTLVEIGLTNVRVLARKAQMALNASMLTNPYVALATVVVGLGITMWALHDSTTAAEKAQESYNKKVEDAAKKAQDHKQNLEGLISELQNEVTAETRKMEILDEIKKGYPSLFQKFIDEKGHVKDLTTAWKAYNEEASRNKAIQNQTNASDLKQNVDEMKRIQEVFDRHGYDFKSYTKEDISLYKKYKPYDKGSLKGEIEEGERELWKWEKEVRDDELNQWKVDLKGKTDEQIKAIREAMIVRSKSAKGDKNLLSALGKRIIALDDESNSRKSVDETQNKSYWEKQKKDAQAKLDALSDIEASGKKGAALKQKITEYDKKIGSFSTNTSKQDSAAEKLRKQKESIREQNEKIAEMDRKQAIDRERQQEDLQNQSVQAEIDAMTNGFEKIEKQRELNNKKEIQSLQRQKGDYIRAFIQEEKEKFDAQEELNAKNIKGYNRKTFDSSSVKVDTSVFDKIVENTKTKQGLNEWEKREQSMNEYLLKYGTFSQKKEAIDKKYRDAIEGETDLGRKDTLQKEWDESISNLNLDKLKQEINWEMIFGDLSKVTKDQLKNIKKQLQEFKNSPEFQKATPEQIQVIEGAFNSINNAMVDKGGFFGGMVDSVRELKLATEELKKAEEELAKANKSGTEAQKEEAQKKVNKAKNRQQNAETDVTKSSDKTIDHLTAVGNAIAQLGSDAEMSLSSFGNAAGSIVDVFTEAGSKIGGLIGAAFSILEGVQKQGLDGFVGNVLENVAGAVGGILDTLTFGVFKLGGADYTHYNEMKEEYEALNSIWDELIDKKKEYIGISYGIEAAKAGKEAESLQRQAIERDRILGLERLNSGASAGSHSIGVRIRKGMSNEGWNQAKKALGTTFDDLSIGDGRMTGLFDLTAKQLETLKFEAPLFWAKLDGDVRGYLDNIIQGEEEIEDIQKQVSEQLTQTSFDNVFDSFMDTLMDMGSAAEDFSDDFGEYMKKAVLMNMMGPEIQEQLKGWYADFSKAMDKKTEKGKFLKPGKEIEAAGVLTEEERDALQNKWDEITKEALDKRDKLAAAMGFESDSSREATQKGVATASQESVDENNGRLTVIQGHTYNINENVNRMVTGIDSIVTHTANLSCLTSIDKTMQSLLTMRNEAIGHLANIDKNTGRLEAIESAITSMRQGIDTLNTKGITIKR